MCEEKAGRIREDKRTPKAKPPRKTKSMGALPTEFSKLYDLGNSDGSFPGWFLGLFAKYLKLRIVEFGYLMHS